MRSLEKEKENEMDKIVVTCEGSKLELGDKLRELIKNSEKKNTGITLNLKYYDAENEQPSTILTNLEKVGIISWISPHFKCPSWALPLAQFSRLRSDKDLWHVLMDPYKFVKIICNAQNFLSTRLHQEEGSIRSIMHCFRPLPVLSTIGYASMTSTHFQGGCDVKAINIRRESCDSAKDGEKCAASLTPELYDYLQKKVWFPNCEMVACASVIELSMSPLDLDCSEAKRVAEVTHYIFDMSGSLCKTLKSNVIVSCCSSDENNSTHSNPLGSFWLAIGSKSDIKRHRRFSIEFTYVVPTSAGTCEMSIMITFNSAAGIGEDDKNKIGNQIIREIVARAAVGLEQVVSPHYVLKSNTEVSDLIEVDFREFIFGYSVFESCKMNNLDSKVLEKSSGLYNGTLEGTQSLPELRRSDNLAPFVLP